MATIPKSASTTYPSAQSTTSTTKTNPQTETTPTEQAANTTAPQDTTKPSAQTPVDTLTTGHRTQEKPDPIRLKHEAATTSFQTRLDDVLNLDAMSMAQGQTAFRNGDTLSAHQQSQLQSATSTFVQDMPLGALAPKFGDAVKDKLNGMGVEVDDLNNMSLREVGAHVGDKAGDFAGDMAKEWAGNLKDKSPAAYYGILATGAAAAGTYGVVAGSKGLKKLGIKPEFKTDLFNKHVTARAEASWDPMLKNFQMAGSLRGQVKTGNNSRLSATVSASENAFSGATLSQTMKLGGVSRGADLRATARFNSDGFSEATGFARLRLSENAQLKGNVRFDDGGFDSASLSGLLRTSPGGFLRGTATFNEGGLETLGGAYRLSQTERKLYLSADLNHNFQLDRTTGGLSLRYRPKSNIDFAISGNLNSDGSSRVGAGLRIRF